MKTYRVEFNIDVEAESPEAAGIRAWELLTAPDAFLPVAEAIEHDGDGWRHEVDLEEIKNEQRSSTQGMGHKEGAPIEGVTPSATRTPGRRADPLAAEGNDRPQQTETDSIQD